MNLKKVNFVAEVRGALKEDPVDLYGFSHLSEEQNALLDEYVDEIHSYLYSFETQSDRDLKVVNRFCERVRKAIDRVYKAAKRLDVPFDFSRDEFENICHSFQDDVGYYADFMGNRKVNLNSLDVTYSVNVYGSLGEVLGDVLDDENIFKHLRAKGYDLSLSDVKEVFRPNEKVRIVSRSILDPLDLVSRAYDAYVNVLSDQAIYKFLTANGFEVKIEDIEKIFTKNIKLRFAFNNLGDPHKPVKKVFDNLKNKLNFESVKSYLDENGYQISREEYDDIFHDYVKLELAVFHINKPLQALKKVVDHINETLKSENIVKYLAKFGYDFSVEDVEETFQKSYKFRFALSNMKDPLKKVKEVVDFLNNSLSDQQILKSLRGFGYNPNLNEINSLFSDAQKLRLAVSNPEGIENAVKVVYKNYADVLDDENVKGYILKNRGDLDEEMFKSIFTDGLKVFIAQFFKSKPLEKALSVYESFVYYSDLENIKKILIEEGIEFQEVFANCFNPSLIVNFAKVVNSRAAILKFYKNINELWDNEEISCYLEQLEMQVSPEALNKLFSKSAKVRIANSYQLDPWDGIEKVARNYLELLSDENVIKYFATNGVEINVSDLNSLFSEPMKCYYAVNVSGDPLKALFKAFDVYKNVLTNENIVKVLAEARIDVSEDQVQEILLLSVRKSIALRSFENPEAAIVEFFNNYFCFLNIDYICEYLRRSGLEVEEEEFSAIFTDFLRKKLSSYSQETALNAVREFFYNYKFVLTNENILFSLYESGFTVDEAVVERVFTQAVRVFFSFNNKKDPLLAIKEVLAGEKVCAFNLEGKIKKAISYAEMFEGLDLFEF